MMTELQTALDQYAAALYYQGRFKLGRTGLDCVIETVLRARAAGATSLAMEDARRFSRGCILNQIRPVTAGPTFYAFRKSLGFPVYYHDSHRTSALT